VREAVHAGRGHLGGPRGHRPGQRGVPDGGDVDAGQSRHPAHPGADRGRRYRRGHPRRRRLRGAGTVPGGSPDACAGTRRWCAARPRRVPGYLRAPVPRRTGLGTGLGGADPGGYRREHRRRARLPQRSRRDSTLWIWRRDRPARDHHRGQGTHRGGPALLPAVRLTWCATARRSRSVRRFGATGIGLRGEEVMRCLRRGRPRVR